MLNPHLSAHLLVIWWGEINIHCLFAHDDTRSTLNVHVAYLTLIDPEPLTLKKDTAGTQSQPEIWFRWFSFSIGWFLGLQPFIFRGRVKLKLAPFSLHSNHTFKFQSISSGAAFRHTPHGVESPGCEAKPISNRQTFDPPRWYLEDAYQNLYLIQ